MSLDDVTTEAAVGLHGQFEIHERALVNAGKRCARPGFRRKVSAKRTGLDVERGETDPADGHAVAGFEFCGRVFGSDGEAAVFAALLDASDASDFFDDAGEHETSESKEIL